MSCHKLRWSASLFPIRAPPMLDKTIQTLLRNCDWSFAHKEIACAKISQSGKLADAPSSSQKSKKRAGIWTDARTKTQRRRDRGKKTRIKIYNKLREAGHDVPTTGAASLRRKQKKKAKVKYLAAAVHGGLMHGWDENTTHAGMTQRTIRSPPKISKYRGE